MNAGDHAIFHNDLLGLRTEKELAPIGFDVRHKGISALLRFGQDHMATAEAHAIGIRNEFHLDAEIKHRVDGLAGVGQAVAQKCAVHRAAREVIHVREDLVESHRGVLLLLKPRLASRGTTAHGEVRDSRRRTHLDDDDLLAASSKIEGRHKPCRTGTHHRDIALFGLFALLARNGLGRCLARIAEHIGVGRRSSRSLRGATGKASPSRQGAQRT